MLLTAEVHNIFQKTYIANGRLLVDLSLEVFEYAVVNHCG